MRDDDELDDADRAVVDKLRALAPEGDEPDWRQLEASIRAAVAPLAPAAPWWRRWRWLVPIGALATTAAILVTISIRAQPSEPRTASRMTMRDASVPSESPTPAPAKLDAPRADGDRAAATGLDGEPQDLDEVSLGDLEDDDALDEPSAVSGSRSDDETLGGRTELGVLPAADYQWIDRLGDDEAARLEAFLARKRS